jgi:hypothetical protein
VAPDDVQGRVDVVVTQARYLPRRVEIPEIHARSPITFK